MSDKIGDALPYLQEIGDKIKATDKLDEMMDVLMNALGREAFTHFENALCKVSVKEKRAMMSVMDLALLVRLRAAAKELPRIHDHVAPLDRLDGIIEEFEYLYPE